MRVSLTLAIFLLLPVMTFGKTIYVDAANTTGPWLGTQAAPYRYIYNDPTPGTPGAIIASSNGDLILVRPGTYVENIDYRGKAITVRSDADFDEATIDFDAKGTVIDGNQSGSVAKFQNGEGNDSVLMGFTLTNGSGTLMSSYTFGGGVFCLSSSPKLMYNIIRENWNIDMGAGIFCHIDANPIILNCAVYNNRATGTQYGSGGGIACWLMCNPLIVNCTFTHNRADNQGGSCWCYYLCNVEVWNTIFANGQAATAAEIWVGTSTYPSSFFIRNSVIEGNNVFVQMACDWDADFIEDGEPELRDVGESDFRLTTKSYDAGCINGGDNAAPLVNELIYDLDLDTYNNSRIIEGISGKVKGNLTDEFIIDIGCDEFRPHYVPLWYSSINEAIASTIAGNYITIYEGTYYESIDFKGNNAVLQSSKDAKASTNDYSPEGTILDGGQNGPVIKFVNNEKGTAQVLGFTITNGYAENGGGILCQGGDPSLQENIITGNTATQYGGGIFLTGAAKVVVKSNVIENNTALAGGGAIGMEDNNASSSFEKNDITNNTANLFGGGVFCLNSTGTLKNNNIFENDAPLGAGVYIDGDEDGLTLQQNSIYHNPTATLGNQPAERGGGVYFKGGVNTTQKYWANIIYENSAFVGGGLYCEGSHPRIENNNIYNNWAKRGGGAAFRNTDLVISQNSFYKNQATESGGAIHWKDSDTSTLINTILWNNTAPVSPQAFLSGTTVSVSYCDIQNGKNKPWFQKFNSFGIDPAWENTADPTSGDFMRLTSLSPCINRGLDSASTAKDIDGSDHNIGGTTDLGSHEFDTKADLLLKSSLKDNQHVIFVLEEEPEPVEFSLNAGSANANKRYYLLGSISWTAPGVLLPSGKRLPLNWDVFTDLVVMFIISPSPLFQDFGGHLDASGTATAVFDFGGHLTLNMVGITMSFAYTLGGPGALWTVVSNPVNVRINES